MFLCSTFRLALVFPDLSGQGRNNAFVGGARGRSIRARHRRLIGRDADDGCFSHTFEMLTRKKIGGLGSYLRFWLFDTGRLPLVALSKVVCAIFGVAFVT